MVTPLTISDNFGYENQPYMMEVETDESELDTFSGKHVEMSYYYADDPFEYYKLEFDVPAALFSIIFTSPGNEPLNPSSASKRCMVMIRSTA